MGPSPSRALPLHRQTTGSLLVLCPHGAKGRTVKPNHLKHLLPISLVEIADSIEERLAFSAHRVCKRGRSSAHGQVILLAPEVFPNDVGNGCERSQERQRQTMHPVSHHNRPDLFTHMYPHNQKHSTIQTHTFIHSDTLIHTIRNIHPFTQTHKQKHPPIHTHKQNHSPIQTHTFIKDYSEEG